MLAGMGNSEQPETTGHPLLGAQWIRVEAVARGRAWLVENPRWPADEVAAELVESLTD